VLLHVRGRSFDPSIAHFQKAVFRRQNMSASGLRVAWNLQDVFSLLCFVQATEKPLLGFVVHRLRLPCTAQMLRGTLWFLVVPRSLVSGSGSMGS
jgi:hypothetical protein